MVDFWTGPLSYINPLAYIWPSSSGDETGNKDKLIVEDRLGQAELGKIQHSSEEIDPLKLVQQKEKEVSPHLITPLKTPTTVVKDDTSVYSDLGPFIGYPKVPEYKPAAFKFRVPEETTVSDKTDLSGFAPIEKTPFKSPMLPSSGIPMPKVSSTVTTATSQTELERRKTQGKIVRWWGLFNHSHNGLSLIGKSEFSKAMKAFPFSHKQTIIRRDDQDYNQHQQNVTAFDEAHHNYLEAHKKPVAVLQSEVAGLPIEDQVRYFNAASNEVTQVSWVKDREWMQEKVERDFKSTALLSLVDSVISRVLKSPTELFKVNSYVMGHLTPFAQIRGEKVDEKNGLFAQPVKHEVTKERKPITMDLHSYKALVQDQISRSKHQIAPEIDVQRWATQEALHQAIFGQVIPELDRLHAPKSLEELEEKMKTNQAALGTLLNDALDGQPIDAQWKQQVRELVDGYRFLEWQHGRFYPKAQTNLTAFNSGRIEIQLSSAVFKYYMLIGQLKKASETPSESLKSRYIQNVKEFMPIQAVIKGIVEAMEGGLSLEFGVQKAIAFNPLASENSIQLTESDLE